MGPTYPDSNTWERSEKKHRFGDLFPDEKLGWSVRDLHIQIYGIYFIDFIVRQLHYGEATRAFAKPTRRQCFLIIDSLFRNANGSLETSLRSFKWLLQGLCARDSLCATFNHTTSNTRRCIVTSGRENSARKNNLRACVSVQKETREKVIIRIHQHISEEDSECSIRSLAQLTLWFRHLSIRAIDPKFGTQEFLDYWLRVELENWEIQVDCCFFFWNSDKKTPYENFCKKFVEFAQWILEAFSKRLFV